MKLLLLLPQLYTSIRQDGAEAPWGVIISPEGWGQPTAALATPWVEIQKRVWVQLPLRSM